MLYDSIHMKHTEQTNSQRQKVYWWLSGGGGKREWGELLIKYMDSIWCDKKTSGTRVVAQSCKCT